MLFYCDCAACREVVFPVVNAKFESRGPKGPDNFRVRLFVLVTSAFATHARNMATVEDFQALWLQLLALVYGLRLLSCHRQLCNVQFQL
jgi:hypothetical protein